MTQLRAFLCISLHKSLLVVALSKPELGNQEKHQIICLLGIRCAYAVILMLLSLIFTKLKSWKRGNAIAGKLMAELRI